MENDDFDKHYPLGLNYMNRSKFGPQLFVRWVFLYQATFKLKIPWATKAMLSLIINMRDIHVNLFKSFSMNEIAAALDMNYNSARRCKMRLIQEGLVTEDGETDFDVTCEENVRNTRK